MSELKLKLTASCVALMTMMGCHGAAPSARLVTSVSQPSASTTTSPSAKATRGLRTLPPAVASRLLAASGAQAKLWGLSFISAERNIQKVRRKEYYQVWTKRKGKRRRLSTREREWTEYIDLGWKLNYSYGGDGMPVHLGYNRFSYMVPEGKVLVLNTVENPSTITVNGFSLGMLYAKRLDARYNISYVFGVGETVVFSMGGHSAISGFTADPELFAGVGFGAGAK